MVPGEPVNRYCDLCGSDDFIEQVLDLGAQPLAENDNGKIYPLAVMRCGDCGLLQLSVTPDEREMFAEDHPYTTGNSRERQRHFAGLAKKVAPLVKADDLVVDIGANDGTFLNALRDITIGIGLLGIEPTKQADKAGDIPVLREFFTLKTARDLVRDIDQKATVITACNVLAHVPDPVNFVAGVAYLLADDGVFITENHDWNSISHGGQIDAVYHEHLRYYTIASLSRLLDEAGLTGVNGGKIPAHGGSFRVTAAKEPRDLQRKADRARQRLRAILEAADGPVYGIGAATRATSLIHFTGIQDRLACVCEVPFSDKIGTKIPGTRIPVVDEKRLIEDQPPFALLFSWHIKDDVIPKIRQMGYKGTFIIPLPEPEVTDG
jgi:C-methyltransferase C-terminal domain/Methyltransferase domain/Putative zinc binding domain